MSRKIVTSIVAPVGEVEVDEQEEAAQAVQVEPEAEKAGQGSIVVKAELQSEPPAPRERKKGVGVQCPKCGKDAFVTQTIPPRLPRTHPGFIEQRIRYLKCGTCEHTFKA